LKMVSVAWRADAAECATSLRTVASRASACKQSLCTVQRSYVAGSQLDLRFECLCAM
jgi:hypothetical protein